MAVGADVGAVYVLDLEDQAEGGSLDRQAALAARIADQGVGAFLVTVENRPQQSGSIALGVA